MSLLYVLNTKKYLRLYEGFKIVTFHTKLFFITDLDTKSLLDKKLKVINSHFDYILTQTDHIKNDWEILSIVEKLYLMEMKGI